MSALAVFGSYVSAWDSPLTVLSNFPVRVSDHGSSTLPGQEVAIPGWRESVILEHCNP